MPSAHVALLPVPGPIGADTGLGSKDGSLPLRRGSQQGQGGPACGENQGSILTKRGEAGKGPAGRYGNTWHLVR